MTMFYTFLFFTFLSGSSGYIASTIFCSAILLSKMVTGSMGFAPSYGDSGSLSGMDFLLASVIFTMKPSS